MVWNIGGNISWGDGVKRQGIATLCLLRSFLLSVQKELEEASLLCSCFGGVCGDFKSLSITWKWSTIWATAQVFCSLFWNPDRKSGYLYFWSKYIKFKALIQQSIVRNIHWPQKWDLLGSLRRSLYLFLWTDFSKSGSMEWNISITESNKHEKAVPNGNICFPRIWTVSNVSSLAPAKKVPEGIAESWIRLPAAIQDRSDTVLLCYKTKWPHFALIYIYVIPLKPVSIVCLREDKKKLFCYIITSMICEDPD